MKLELALIGITLFFIINTYYDNKYIKLLKAWKKYYQIGIFVFAGLSLYIFIKKNPTESKNLLSHANGIIKYMPIDKNSADLLTPLLSYHSHSNNENTAQFNRMINSGNKNPFNNKNVKRSVSETKKKFIAANQNWKCASCNTQLEAWYEIDHKIRLDKLRENKSLPRATSCCAI